MNEIEEKYGQVCPKCGQGYYWSHYCTGPQVQKAPWIPGTVPAKALTEADVRRIVQEEIAKCLGKLP